MANDPLLERAAAIKANWEWVQSRIAQAAHKAGRDPAEVELVAVTKLVPLETVRAAVQVGMTCFGENYPEQALEKIQTLGSEGSIKWHMIGHIQSRKAATVARYFDRVHSLDRMKIARVLNQHCAALNKTMPALLEVNVSGEDSKFGFPAWDEAHWLDLLSPFREILALSNLSVRGLMSMPPFFDDAEESRPLYQRLKRLQAFLRETLPEGHWDELSIGTSFDYPVAVEEGATFVRIGTQLFGPRPSLEESRAKPL